MSKSRLASAFVALFAAASAHAEVNATGTWYNPMQSGHGVTLQELNDGRGLLFWFSYDFDGSPMPLYAEVAKAGDGAYVGPAYRVSGSEFFGNFDPREFRLQPWGSVSFAAAGCGQAAFRYAGDGGYGAAEIPMVPLAKVSGIECSAPLAQPSAAAMANPLVGMTGSWYHPQFPGQNVFLQMIDAERALVYWFSFDHRGRPMPLYAEMHRDGDLLKGTALLYSGMRFGEFQRSALSVREFGSVELSFRSCDNALLRWNSAFYAGGGAPYGVGQLPLTRLTFPKGITCTSHATVPAEFPSRLDVTLTQAGQQTRSKAFFDPSTGDLVMEGRAGGFVPGLDLKLRLGDDISESARFDATTRTLDVAMRAADGGRYDLRFSPATELRGGGMVPESAVTVVPTDPATTLPYRFSQIVRFGLLGFRSAAGVGVAFDDDGNLNFFDADDAFFHGRSATGQIRWRSDSNRFDFTLSDGGFGSGWLELGAADSTVTNPPRQQLVMVLRSTRYGAPPRVYRIPAGGLLP